MENRELPRFAAFSPFNSTSVKPFESEEAYLIGYGLGNLCLYGFVHAAAFGAYKLRQISLREACYPSNRRSYPYFQIFYCRVLGFATLCGMVLLFLNGFCKEIVESVPATPGHNEGHAIVYKKVKYNCFRRPEDCSSGMQGLCETRYWCSIFLGILPVGLALEDLWRLGFYTRISTFLGLIVIEDRAEFLLTMLPLLLLWKFFFVTYAAYKFLRGPRTLPLRFGAKNLTRPVWQPVARCGRWVLEKVGLRERRRRELPILPPEWLDVPDDTPSTVTVQQPANEQQPGNEHGEDIELQPMGAPTHTPNAESPVTASAEELATAVEESPATEPQGQGSNGAGDQADNAGNAEGAEAAGTEPPTPTSEEGDTSGNGTAPVHEAGGEIDGARGGEGNSGTRQEGGPSGNETGVPVEDTRTEGNGNETGVPVEDTPADDHGNGSAVPAENTHTDEARIYEWLEGTSDKKPPKCRPS